MKLAFTSLWIITQLVIGPSISAQTDPSIIFKREPLTAKELLFFVKRKLELEDRADSLNEEARKLEERVVVLKAMVAVRDSILLTNQILIDELRGDKRELWQRLDYTQSELKNYRAELRLKDVMMDSIGSVNLRLNQRIDRLERNLVEEKLTTKLLDSLLTLRMGQVVDLIYRNVERSTHVAVKLKPGVGSRRSLAEIPLDFENLNLVKRNWISEMFLKFDSGAPGFDVLPSYYYYLGYLGKDPNNLEPEWIFGTPKIPKSISEVNGKAKEPIRFNFRNHRGYFVLVLFYQELLNGQTVDQSVKRIVFKID